MTMPPSIPWLWSHAACLPDTNDYDIAAERFNTVGKVLDWTLHLMTKTWFDPIPWADAVRRFYILPDA